MWKYLTEGLLIVGAACACLGMIRADSNATGLLAFGAFAGPGLAIIPIVRQGRKLEKQVEEHDDY